MWKPRSAPRCALTEAERGEISLIENLQREDLNPIEEATAYKTLMERFSLTQEELASRLGKGRPTVANSLRLLNLAPAVQELQQRGVAAAGPVSADSVFHLAKLGRYNSVLSLYHDQGHIAAKTLDFERTVSVTGGMPILRTSVDHGTAFDIAGTGRASEISMVEAIKTAAKYARRFRAHTQTAAPQ